MLFIIRDAFFGESWIDQVWHLLTRGLDIPPVAVLAAKKVTEVTLWACQLHGVGLPFQVITFMLDGDIPEQDGLGERACIIETIAGLLARDNSVEPAVEVILVIRRLVCVVCVFFLRVKLGSPDVREDQSAFITDEEGAAGGESLVAG